MKQKHLFRTITAIALTALIFVSCEKEEPFTPTQETFTDERDGNTYKWIKIGEQIWMAENLAYLPEVQSNANFVTKGTDEEPAYGVYGYDGSDVATAKAEANYDTYGVLYNWYAVDQANVCPSGWHIPSDDEWKTLEIELGMSQEDAENIKWRGTNEGATLAGNFDL